MATAVLDKANASATAEAEAADAMTAAERAASAVRRECLEQTAAAIFRRHKPARPVRHLEPSGRGEKRRRRGSPE